MARLVTNTAAHSRLKSLLKNVSREALSMQALRPWAAAAATLVMLLSGCSATEPPSIAPLSIEDGVPHYRSMTLELMAALSAKFPTVEWSREATEHLGPREDGQGCSFHPASYESKQGLEKASPRFKEVMAAVNPVLEKFHFTKVEKLADVPGGWTVIKSSDRHGASLSLSAKGTTLLSLGAPLKASDCNVALPAYGS
jgi:hypothetical protein